MVKEITDYVSIRELLSRLTRHKLLKDLDMDKVIYHTMDFIDAFGMPALYFDKVANVEIHEYRGTLPCDLVSIEQVKDCASGICMRKSTDTFMFGDRPSIHTDPSFRVQGSVIYTTFREGSVDVAYRAIPVDNEGYPALPNNNTFLKALELYIKKEEFLSLFEEGKIQYNVFAAIQTEYGFAVRLCTQEFVTPSISEMESISRMWSRLVPDKRSFDYGYASLGDREQIKKS